MKHLLIPLLFIDMSVCLPCSGRAGGWGYGAFEYKAASDTFVPANMEDNPPQGNDAKCGFACHTVVKNRDYVFTDYGKR
jgi:hypothetical protein